MAFHIVKSYKYKNKHSGLYKASMFNHFDKFSDTAAAPGSPENQLLVFYMSALHLLICLKQPLRHKHNCQCK